MIVMNKLTFVKCHSSLMRLTIQFIALPFLMVTLTEFIAASVLCHIEINSSLVAEGEKLELRIGTFQK